MEEDGQPLNESIQQLIIASCLLEPSLSHLASEVAPLPQKKLLPEDFRHRCTALSTALLAPKCFLWASAGSLALVSHLSSVWKSVPPMFFLGFVISLQLAQTESNAETRKTQLQSALEGLLARSSHADASVQHAIQRLQELENQLQVPDWRAFSLKVKQDLEKLEEVRQASGTLRLTLRDTAKICQEASSALSNHVSSEEQLQRLLEMHKVERRQEEEDASNSPTQPRLHDLWTATPLRLPKTVKRSSWAATGNLNDGGILPVSPRSPAMSTTSRVARQSSLRRSRQSRSVDYSKEASPSPGFRRALSIQTAVDSPLRQTAFSPTVAEHQEVESESNEGRFDFGRSESYAKLTCQAPSPALGSPAQVATKSSNRSDVDDFADRSWDFGRDVEEPLSAPPTIQAQHLSRSNIGTVTGTLSSALRESPILPGGRAQHQRHRRLSSSISPSGYFSSQSPLQESRRRGIAANKRFSLLSQHSTASRQSSTTPFTAGLFPDDGAPQTFDEEAASSPHIVALQASYDQMHTDRRRFLCALMAVDYARLLSRTPEKLGDVSSKIALVADSMDHLQLVAERETDRLPESSAARYSEAMDRSGWSPLLPGAWSSSRRDPVHLSPFDMPKQHSYDPDARRRQSFSADQAERYADFAPPTSPAQKLRASSTAFGSKRNNMSRALRSIAAKLDIASDELQQRLTALGTDSSSMHAIADEEREQDLLAVHDSIRSDLEGLLRDWDESRVLLRTALHPEQREKARQRGLNDSALSRVESDQSGIKDVEDSGDEPSMPSLSHSTSEKRASSVFSSEARTPERASPPKDIVFDQTDESTPTNLPALEEVFEAVASKDLSRSKLSREERIRLAKEKRAAEEIEGQDPQQNPLLSGQSSLRFWRCCTMKLISAII